MTDFRALCEQLMELVEGKRYDGSALIAKARAELAKPAPEPPTETTTEELLQLAREWNSGYESIEFEFIDDYARAVLARWGNA
jgi:hypothetical protein